MHYLETPRGLKWHYDAEGQGPGLLFIHGWGVDRRIWRQQYKFFSGYYQVVAVDLPGHGETPWQTMTLEEIAEDLRFVLGHVGCQSYGVVASSFGGLVALQLADVDPQLVKLLVLVGSQAKFIKGVGHPYGLEIERLRRLSGQLDSDYPSIINIFFRSLFTKQERASRRYKWIQTFRRTEGAPNKEALLGLLNILEETDLRETLLRLEQPLQFINGTEDYICPQELYRELMVKIPEAQFDWMPECGHFPFLIQPYAFNKLLKSFLAGAM